MKRPPSHGFTLIELLIVITVIAILAALTMNVAGYVQDKAARERARTEIESIGAALTSYKAEHGDYPLSASPQTNANSTDQTIYTNLSPLTGKVYHEFPKGMTNANKAVIDPFGNGYGYQYPGDPNRSGAGFYDLFSTANKGANSNAWIKNW